MFLGLRNVINCERVIKEDDESETPTGICDHTAHYHLLVESLDLSQTYNKHMLCFYFGQSRLFDFLLGLFATLPGSAVLFRVICSCRPWELGISHISPPWTLSIHFTCHKDWSILEFLTLSRKKVSAMALLLFYCWNYL